MSVIDTVPTTRAVLPSIVQGHSNGRLPAELLRNFDGRGSLLRVVSYGMQALHLQALADDVEGFGPIQTRTVGRYRTYARQEQMFRERYTTTPLPGRPTKSWQGQTWYQRPGTAMSATPGTSNHGWGAADDVAEERTGDNTPDGMSDRQLRWMRDNAPSFGFGLETRKERWHWHWIRGNYLPPRAVAVLVYCGIPVPPDLVDPQEVDMPDLVDHAPVRVLDTRSSGGKLRAGQPRKVAVTMGHRAQVNVTVTQPAAAGWVAVAPENDFSSPTSLVNFVAGQTVANATRVACPDGHMWVMASADCHLVLDVSATGV